MKIPILQLNAHDMTPNGIKIHSSPSTVSIQHRARITPLGAFACTAFAAFMMMGPAKALQVSKGTLHAREIGLLIVGFVLLAVTMLGLLSLVVGISLEFLHVDARQALIGRKRYWFHWRRESIPVNEIRNLEYAVLNRSKGGVVMGLKFEARGRTYKLFRDLKATDGERIVTACRSLGIKTKT